MKHGGRARWVLLAVIGAGMGGDLTVESTPGVGSAFTLTLPRA